MRWTPIMGQPESVYRAANFGIGSGHAWREGYAIGSTFQSVPIVHTSKGICIVGLARRAIAQTLVLTLQRFLGQGLTICLTLPGPPQPSGTHLLLADLPGAFFRETDDDPKPFTLTAGPD